MKLLFLGTNTGLPCRTDLHACGSTLLMGRLCSFDDSNVRRESLSASWKLCLECLSRYTGLSSVANKSFCLLQESARRPLPQDQQILLPLSSSSPDSPSQVLRTGMMPYGDNGG